jgi:hypothetical protein
MEESEPVPPNNEIRINKRISTATTILIAAIDEMANVTRDLCD